jgi:N6-L-threonylcarbamoyladenine synthase
LIERLARGGSSQKIKFSCSNTQKPLDFSFSGIKTAVLYKLQAPSSKLQAQKADIAASFQEAVINTLIKKSLLACQIKKVKRLVIGGGVAANNRLRERFCREAAQKDIKCYFPSQELCLDNAAMVAGLGYQLFRKGYRSGLGLSVEFY